MRVLLNGLVGVSALVGLLLTTGCMPMTTMGLARPVPRGHLEVAAGGQWARTRATEGTGLAWNPDLAVRYGLSDNVDVGGRLTAGSASLETKVSLLRAPSLSEGVDVALAPAISMVAQTPFDANWQGGAWSGALSVPVLLGINVPGGHQLVLAGRGMGRTRLTSLEGDWIASSEHGTEVFAGASAGFAWRVSPGVHLMPEVAILTPVWWNDSRPSPPFTYVQAGVALLFGGGRDAQSTR